MISPKHSSRSIKYEIHIATGCFFSKEEINRLEKIKNNPSWIPAGMRGGKKHQLRKLRGTKGLLLALLGV